MQMIWRLKRIRNMSPREIPHRVAEQWKRARSRYTRYEWADFASHGAAPIIPHLKEAILSNATDQMKEAVRAHVDRLLAGHFELHGVAWPKRDPDDLFPHFFWRQDPVTGQLWPDKNVYCFDVEYRNEQTLGDIKYVWDLNRLQFLQPLAMAAALGVDERALAALEAAIRSWSEGNPPFQGVSWNSGIELALRTTSLIFAASLCADRMSASAIDRLRAILSAHLYWLRRFPSRFSSANNHRISEAMGEFLIAQALPDLPSAAQYAEEARSILEHEAVSQLLEDGVGAEQSPTYGAFVAETILVANFVARANGRQFQSAVNDRLVAFGNYIAWLTDSNGRAPSIGDDDQGRVLTPVGQREHCYPASVATAIAGFLGRPGFGARPRERTEIRDALFNAPTVSNPAPEGICSFETGGYSIVRETRAGKKVLLVFDHGPLGYLAIAAHGHADANAITLSLDDLPILVDPGTYLYHSGGEWRDWFRGTRAHNTLNLRGVNQSAIAGPFNWSHKARAWLESIRNGPDWTMVGRHDGYVSRFGVEHQRTVSSSDDGMEILDRLLPGPSDVPAEVVFQFASDLVITGEGLVRTISRHDEVLVRIAFDSAGEIELQIGGESKSGGWASSEFGKKEPAPRLVWRGLIPAGGLRTVITWSGQAPKVTDIAGRRDRRVMGQ